MIALLVLVAVLPVASAAAADSPPETAPPSSPPPFGIAGSPAIGPISAEREPSVSQAGRAAWIIRCDAARYRVVFDGDTGARVLPLE